MKKACVVAAFGRIYKIVAKRHRSSLSVAIAMLYSMFVKYFVHKGPRPEARPWLMAAFYNFKAAVSDLNFHDEAESGARRPACAKFADAAT